MTQVNDIVKGPAGEGERIVLWVIGAGDYIAQQSASTPLHYQYQRGSSAEKCALYGTTKALTPQERHGCI